MRTLVHRGWFIDPEMSLPKIRSLHEAFLGGREKEAEDWLVAYYGEHAQTIVERLSVVYPERATQLTDALCAHNEGRYSLSVPVFLLQADGLANHLKKGRQLFSKDDRKSVRGLIKGMPDESMERVFLSVYGGDSVLVMRTNDLPPEFNGLNRHGVLHGTDVNYGTEINSLRALSVLAYAAFSPAPRAGLPTES